MTNYKETLMWKEINETPRIFGEIRCSNHTTMQSLVDELKANPVRGVYASGRGTSDHALIYFKYLTETFAGLPVALAAPSVLTLYNGKLNLKNQLVIGCSQSGKAADVLEIIKRANEQGAITVSVTNDATSPLAKTAKYHLYCNAGEEKSVAATKTFSAQLYLMLWLSANLAGLSEVTDMLDGYTALLPQHVEAIDKITDKIAPNYYNMQSGFVLSRGITYAIALEATLKLQETSYVQMKGYPASDFYHGPMAMVNKGTPVFMYSAKYNFGVPEMGEIVLADEQKCIDKMIELGADVILVTDDEYLKSRYENFATVALLPPTYSEAFTMFDFALFAQMLACKISCGKGRNPDSPRALNKVTITK